jgi:hypothetical protein
MQVEWLALWCHFLWSGVLTMAFCTFTWWKTGVMLRASQQATNGNNANSEAWKEGEKQRRRILRIAVMVSFCLFLNATATLSTSAKLEDWSRTADIALTCAIKETWGSRAWDTYGFGEEIVSVCGLEDANSNKDQAGNPCLSDCFWYPAITRGYLTCRTELVGYDSLEEQAEYMLSLEEGEPGFSVPCDCPCSSLIEIERPRLNTVDTNTSE